MNGKDKNSCGAMMPGMSMGKPSGGDDAEPGVMMAKHYRMSGWVQPVLMLLGVWLASSPFLLDYGDAALALSDVASGVAVVALAFAALRKPGMRAGVANCFAGIWILFAPLLFWAPSAAAYLNGTLIGTLVIAFSLLVPMSHEMRGADVPPGWSYNPSSWQQRIPIVALGFFGFFVSRYMAAYQLGYIDSVWDPFFGDGTQRILNSEVSKAWPVSDAGLGAAVYLIEALSGLMGDKRRWRTMPWMVAVFGFAVVPLGIVSIALVTMQPLAVGAWCTLCLLTAAAMLVMVALSLDEVVAMIQFLARSRREGKSVWRVFWMGGHAGDAERRSGVKQPAWALRPMVWGVTPSRSLVALALLGLWAMVAPDVFGIAIDKPAADSDHLLGALLVVVAVVAMAEVARPLRALAVPIGLWFAVAPWAMSSATTGSRLSDLFVGLAVIALSVPAGKIRDHYGALDRKVRWRVRVPFLARRAPS